VNIIRNTTQTCLHSIVTKPYCSTMYRLSLDLDSMRTLHSQRSYETDTKLNELETRVDGVSNDATTARATTASLEQRLTRVERRCDERVKMVERRAMETIGAHKKTIDALARQVTTLTRFVGFMCVLFDDLKQTKHLLGRFIVVLLCWNDRVKNKLDC
jgi:hypothetical protein